MGTIHALLWSSIEQHNTLAIQSSYFAHLHSLPHQWHLHKNQNGEAGGDLFSIAESGSEGLNNLLEHLLFSITPTIADIIITIIYLSSIFNFWIGFIVVAQVIIYLLATIALMEWKKTHHKPMNVAYTAKHAFSIDSLLNFETVKYFTNEDYEVSQMRQRIINYQAQEYKVNSIGKVMDLIQVSITTFGLLLTSGICGWLVYNGRSSIGDYFLFFSHFGQLHGLLKYFGSYYRSIGRSLINMEALMEILKEEPEEKEKIDENSSVQKYSPLPKPIKGHIEFINVSFGYELNKPILKQISFVIQPGQSLALVGPSGEGKSTILKLLYRFIHPWSGQILIDGQPICNYPLKWLRSQLGIIPQDTILFNDTLRKNISYGNVTAPNSKIVEASRIACLHDKIQGLANQYETQVGERGCCLSGGEKLRVTIARLILKNCSIYCFDEATSSLDSSTEKFILEQLELLTKDKTIIIITHRLATIINSDVILVLMDGRITESGTHSSLLKQNGVYAKMWKEQQLESK